MIIHTIIEKLIIVRKIIVSFKRQQLKPHVSVTGNDN